jgi:hypothetical protein
MNRNRRELLKDRDIIMSRLYELSPCPLKEKVQRVMGCGILVCRRLRNHHVSLDSRPIITSSCRNPNPNRMDRALVAKGQNRIEEIQNSVDGKTKA